MDTNSKRLILVGHLEGVSYLVLLLIAMPLKYFYGMPMPVRIVGGVHGALFILFSFALLQAYRKIPLLFGLSLQIFILSFVPFGTFFIKSLIPRKMDSPDIL